MADLLTKLSSKYGCDKSDKNHKYTPRYHAIFEKFRHKEFNMVEYGFGQGKSVKLWMEYFTKAHLLCIDIREELPNDELIQQHAESGRFEFLSANQIDKKKIVNVFKRYGSFFMMIDDASHKSEDQQYTMSFSFPFVQPGGWYIIEDLKCKRKANETFKIKADKTLLMLENYTINKKFNSKILTKKQNLYLNENISGISIYDKIAFIKKRG